MAFMRSRRVMLWFGVLLVTPMLPNVALSKPEDARPGASLAGQLLVATPEMSDPRFRHTVILMVRHNKDGALGIAINRPVRELSVAKLLDALGLDSNGSEGTVRLFAGGPVQPDAGFIVHSAEYHRPGTVDIDGHVAMTTNPEVLRDIGRHRGPRQKSRRVRLRRLGTRPARSRTGTRRLVHGAGGFQSGIRCGSRQAVGRGDETPHHFALIRSCTA